MQSIKLDMSRLFGFKIIKSNAAATASLAPGMSAKLGDKAGAKLGQKVGSKIGGKVGVKTPSQAG